MSFHISKQPSRSKKRWDKQGDLKVTFSCQRRGRKESGEGSEGKGEEQRGRPSICWLGFRHCVFLLLSSMPADPPSESQGPWMRSLGFSTIKSYRLRSIINARDETVQPAVHMLPGPDPLLACLSASSLAFILHWCQHQICSSVSAPLSCSVQLIFSSLHFLISRVALDQVISDLFPLKKPVFLGPFPPEGIELLHVHQPHRDPYVVTHTLSSSGPSIQLPRGGAGFEPSLDAQLCIQ